MSENEHATIPDNHVLGVVKGSPVKTLSTDLRRAGFDDFTIMGRDEIEHKVDADQERSGPVTRALHAIVNHLSEQVEYLQQYEEEAAMGNSVVAVKVKDNEEAQRVNDILQRNNVVDIRFFGKLAVTDMTPGTNPSAPSDQRP